MRIDSLRLRFVEKASNKHENHLQGLQHSVSRFSWSDVPLDLIRDLEPVLAEHYPNDEVEAIRVPVLHDKNELVRGVDMLYAQPQEFRDGVAFAKGVEAPSLQELCLDARLLCFNIPFHDETHLLSVPQNTVVCGGEEDDAVLESLGTSLSNRFVTSLCRIGSADRDSLIVALEFVRNGIDNR